MTQRSSPEPPGGPRPTSDFRLTIISCFFNSVPRLPLYFAALEALELGSAWVEFVLVDNASDDHTLEQLRAGAARLPGRTKVLTEPKTGQMHARCTGLA